MAKEPEPIAEIEIECPYYKKWIHVKIFKKKVSEALFEFKAKVSIPQPELFQGRK